MIWMNFEAKNLAQALIYEVTRIPYDENLIQELLKKISAAGDPHIICFILPLVWPIAYTDTWAGAKKTTLVLQCSASIKSAALKVISTLLAQTQPEGLPAVSQCWTDSFCVDGLKGWFTIEPPSPDEIEEVEAKLYLLGIISFNKNGYIREKAVAALAKLSDPAALPFILCRTVDWVPEVRRKAVDVLETKLIPGNADAFIKLLPLMNRLALSSRAMKSLEAKVCGLYHSDLGIQLLLSALKTEPQHIRLLICRILDSFVPDIPAEILDIVTKDCDLAVRFWLTRWEERMRSFNPTGALQLRKLLIYDPSAKIRNSMILASLAAQDDDVNDILYKGLFDKSSGIRDMARYYIKKNKALDFASLYREMLTEKGVKLQIAIAGLGETGTSSDYELILPLLSGSTRQTCAALKALVKLDSSRARQVLLYARADHRPAVRGLALKNLPKWLSAEDEEILLDVWQRAASEDARGCVAQTMLRLPPWIAGHALLRAVTICPLSQEAVRALEQWYPSRQKCYAPIPPEEKEKIAIKNALTAAAPFLNESVVNKVLGFI